MQFAAINVWLFHLTWNMVWNLKVHYIKWAAVDPKMLMDYQDIILLQILSSINENNFLVEFVSED